MPTQLAQRFVERGLLAPPDAHQLVRSLDPKGPRLDTLLLERGAPEAQVLAALSDAAQVPPVRLEEFEPNRQAAALIPGKVAERLMAVPLSIEAGTLHVACAYPLPTTELDEVATLLGKRVTR